MVPHATELSCILLNSFYAAGLNARKLTILHVTALLCTIELSNMPLKAMTEKGALYSREFYAVLRNSKEFEEAPENPRHSLLQITMLYVENIALRF